MNKFHASATLAAAGLLSCAASAVTLTGQRVGGSFIWTLTGDKVASLHVTGQLTGENNGSTQQPAGWSFTGSLFQGDYSWESPTNKNGSFQFVANHQTLIGIATPTSAQYDYIDDTGKRVMVDIDITPVPEPASMAALGIGALALLRRRTRAK